MKKFSCQNYTTKLNRPVQLQEDFRKPPKISDTEGFRFLEQIRKLINQKKLTEIIFLLEQELGIPREKIPEALVWFTFQEVG